MSSNLFYSTRKPKIFEKFFEKLHIKKMDRVARRGPLARAPGALKRGHVRNCQHFCRSWRGDPSEKKQIFEKISQGQKTERGDTLGFSNIHSDAKQQKNEEGTLWENFFWKSLAVPKKMIRGPFGLARYGMIRGKTRKTFLVQFARPNSVQFGAIIFCRTFKNYFGQFVWIKKVTIIVAFHFMKRRLKKESL